MSLKTGLKRFWKFLWESDSWASWITLLVIAFLLVRLVIFPVLGLALGGTELPLVVIESQSMEHSGSFEDWLGSHGEWYFENNISREEMISWEFREGLDKGDIVITKKVENYKIGEVIIFKVKEQKTPIIHRIVKYDDQEDEFETKGDNNIDQIPYERAIGQDQIVSKALVRIPKIGLIKVYLVERLRALAA